MDDAQFDALHTALAPEVYRYAARRTAHHTAEDVVNETFTALWGHRDRIPLDLDDRRAWVFGVARVQLARAQRVEARHRRLSARLHAVLHGEGPAQGDDVALTVLATEGARRAWKALDRRDQDVLSMVVWEGMQPREVAAVLGVSLTAVTSRVHRARRRLALLQGADGGDGL